ncbi:uncharacterized protein CCOS01_00957 [Colletotrichum costaricense]|uniref:Uncharacterized protein n=1 Tax=Colletotrichum costaricense TaxID=1209916 RepID=A0AAJ0E8H9_9PEZI|nr:uncharacterized protein CCOS01_00957 [Colletotrichum costaricense]KAK1539643.1 hypothetical protein CCOS01_00957 [Colletotrichum costaricense]
MPREKEDRMIAPSPDPAHLKHRQTSTRCLASCPAVPCPPQSIARSYSSMIHPMAGGMAPVFTSASSGRNHGYASRASMKLGIIRTNADYGQIRKLVSLTQSRDGTIIIHDLELSWPIPPCTTESSSKGIHPFLLLQYQHARQAFDYKLVSVVCLRDIRTMMQQGPYFGIASFGLVAAHKNPPCQIFHCSEVFLGSWKLALADNDIRTHRNCKIRARLGSHGPAAMPVCQLVVRSLSFHLVFGFIVSTSARTSTVPFQVMISRLSQPGNSVIARPLALADLEKTTHPGTSLSNGFQACLPLILTEYLESSLVRCAPRPPTIQTELLPSPQCKSIAVAKTTATRIVRGRARAQMQSHMPPEVHSAEGDENGLSGPVTDDQSRGEKPTLASTARIAIHAMSSSAHVLRPYCMSPGIDRSAAALVRTCLEF